MKRLSPGDFKGLGTFFRDIDSHFEQSKKEQSVDIKESVPDSLVGADPMTSSDEQIDKMIAIGIANVKRRLSEEHLDFRDKSLHESLTNKALEKAFLLWEVSTVKNKQPFMFLFGSQIDGVLSEYFKTANSKELLSRKGRATFSKYMDEYGLETSDTLVQFEIIENAFEFANTEHDKSYNSINREMYEELFLGWVKSSSIEYAKSSLYGEESEVVVGVEKSEIDYDKNHRAFKIKDIAEIDEECYGVLMQFAIAFANKIANMSSFERADKAEIEMVAREAFSYAVQMFDPLEAAAKDSTFSTFLGWKIRGAYTDYGRRKFKDQNNIMRFAGSEDGGVDFNDFTGESDFVNSSKSGDAFYRDTSVSQQDLINKKLIGIRAIRFEFPQYSNFLIDVATGDFVDEEGKKISFVTLGEMLNEKPEKLREQYAAVKLLLRRKLARKGFLDVFEDDEKGVEDLEKETNVMESIYAQEEADNILSSVDVQEIETGELSGQFEGVE